MRWLADEWDYRDPKPYYSSTKKHTDFIRQQSNAIGAGDPLSEPGKWPQNVRQFFQDTDFHVYGNKVYKKVDPVADAKDDNVGLDIADADGEEAQKYLEEIKDRPDVKEFLKGAGSEFFAPAKKEESTDALDYAEHGAIDFADDADPYEVLGSIDTISLNSKFCALGYRPPKDRYEWENSEHNENSWADLADERKMHRTELLKEIEDICYVADINKFYWRIRDDYYADKEIQKTWSVESFKMDRAIYEDSLRRQGYDEETIRRKLWGGFDAVRVDLPMLIDKQTREIVRIARRQMDSIWRRARSQAMLELTLTSSQWREVYTALRAKKQYLLTEQSKISRINYTKVLKAISNLSSLNKFRPKLVKIAKERLNRRDTNLLWLAYKERMNALKKAALQEAQKAKGRRKSENHNMSGVS